MYDCDGRSAVAAAAAVIAQIEWPEWADDADVVHQVSGIWSAQTLG